VSLPSPGVGVELVRYGYAGVSLESARSTSTSRRLAGKTAKTLLLLASTALSVVLAESGLRVWGYEPPSRHRSRLGRKVIMNPGRGLPYLYEPHGSFSESWPSDPDGYFGNGDNEIRYRVNNAGFRGPDFARARNDRVRVAFVGDSFCWGNGVRQEDHFTTVLQKRLERAKLFQGRFEILNFGLGSYSTLEEVALFQEIVLQYQPDVCVIWYFLNDTEDLLVTVSASHAPRQGPNPYGVGHVGTVRYLRGDRLWIDMYLGQREVIRQYTRNHLPRSPQFLEMTAALARFAEACRAHDIVPVLAVHPVLLRLDDDYPFQAAHSNVVAAARSEGIFAFDLLPYLRGRRARRLWVHPVDPHPNHVAHRLCGEGFAGDLLAVVRDQQHRIARHMEEALRAPASARSDDPG